MRRIATTTFYNVASRRGNLLLECGTLSREVDGDHEHQPGFFRPARQVQSGPTAALPTSAVPAEGSALQPRTPAFQ